MGLKWSILRRSIPDGSIVLISVLLVIVGVYGRLFIPGLNLVTALPLILLGLAGFYVAGRLA